MRTMCVPLLWLELGMPQACMPFAMARAMWMQRRWHACSQPADCPMSAPPTARRWPVGSPWPVRWYGTGVPGRALHRSGARRLFACPSARRFARECLRDAQIHGAHAARAAGGGGVMGELLGADPLGMLFGSAQGLAMLCLGTICYVGGLLWMHCLLASDG